MAIKKFGNSAGVVIPKPLLNAFGAQAGDSVEMTIEDGPVVIERVVRASRQGWAEDAKGLAEAGDDALAWPESPMMAMATSHGETRRRLAGRPRSHRRQ